jgi:hypothetical protein
MSRPIPIDENGRLNMSIKLLWSILGAVAFGAFFAAGLLGEVKATRKAVESVTPRLDDHERRIIRIESIRVGSKTNRNDNVAAY